MQPTRLPADAPAVKRRCTAWRAYLLAGVAAIAFYFAAPARTQEMLHTASGLAAALLLAGRAARCRRPERRAWALLALALACLTAGDLVRTYFYATDRIPFPSLADGLYLAAHPLLAAGFGSLTTGRRAGGDKAGLLDSAIVAASLTIPAWVWLVAPAAGGSGSWPAALAAAAYPLMDALILAVLVRPLLSADAARGSAVMALGGLALLAQVVASLVYSVLAPASSYTRSGAPGAGWLAIYVLWGCAALHPAAASGAGPQRELRPGRQLRPAERAALLGAAAIVGPAYQIGLALAGSNDLTIEVALATLFTFALVVARLGGLLDKVQRRMDEAGARRAELERALSAKRSLEEKLAERALHDSLTGLATKALLMDRIQEALKRTERSGGRHAVLFIDLDDFKSINQRLGHDVGDLVLTELAARLQRALRAGDTAARIGGEEFAVLLEGVTEREARRVAERVHRAVAGRFTAKGRSVEVRIALGVALSAPGLGAAELLFAATLAANAAKEDGGGRWLVFDEAQHSPAVRRVTLVRDLEDALGHGELTLHYQPVVDLASGRITAVEPLLRWHHPRRGLLTAGEFIDAAASVPGLMATIDETTSKLAVAQVANWRRSFFAAAELCLSLNVTPGLVGRPGFVEQIADLLARHALPAHALVLEITERELVAQFSGASSALDRLRAIGVAIAIDDFGMGYSSLGYLKHLPVAVLKIDRAFVEPVPGSPEDNTLVAAIIKIGHTRRLKVVAEGIERPEQADALRAMGCRYGQGFGLVPPLAPQDLATLLGDGAVISLPEALAAQQREQLVRRRDRRSKAARPRLQVPVVGDDNDRLRR